VAAGARIAAVLAALAFAGAAVVACRQLVGIGDAPPGASGGPGDAAGGETGEAGLGCGITFAGASCEACITTSCCGQAIVCSGSTSCSVLASCLAACGGNPTCRSSCPLGSGSLGDPATPALFACVAAECGAPCNLPCGGLFTNVVDAAAGCETCMKSSSACAKGLTCASDVACASGLLCALGTHTPDTLQQCWTGDDAGFTEFTAWLAAVSGDCPACAVSTDWSCAGKVQWPESPPHPLTLDLLVETSIGGMALAGVTATLCNPASSTCAPLATATTGADGTAHLSLPGGTTGYLGPSGYLDLSMPDGGIVPELYDWGFPLTESEVHLTAAVISPVMLDSTLSALGVTPDPTRGYVVASAFDCVVAGAAGVQAGFMMGADAETKCFYFENGIPSTTATATDRSGVAVCMNVLPGPVTVTETPTGFASPVGSVPTFVRPGEITYITLLPTPSP